jgi:predicted amidohydrolase
MPAPRTLRVAAAQYPLDRPVSLDAVTRKLTSWIERAHAGGAQLVVFPEYGAMEIAGAAPDALAGDLAQSLDLVARDRGAVETHLADVSRRLGIHILAPSGPELSEGRYVNRARLFAPSGQHGAQDKMIMTPFENKWGISAGKTLHVFRTEIGTLAILICYDSEFPLLARAAAEAGADVLLIPSCTERLSGYHRVRAAAQARALENTCVTIQSPTIGDAPWSPAVDRNSGAAGVFVPAEAGLSETGVLAEGTLNAPEFIFADVDLDHLAQLRAEGGEMRNTADWRLQPGADRPLPSARVIDLR